MATTDLATQEAAPTVGLMQIIAGLAANPDVDIDKIHRLLEMQERWEVNNDKKKFREAMAAFKLDPPKILKEKLVSFKTDKGMTEYNHAELHKVCEAIVRRLAEAGITHRWVPSQPATGGITVTCVLSLGMFSEETPLSASPDTSGGKNPVQGIASTVSYLERYTLLAATGCATGMPDNDGASVLPQAVQNLVDDISKAADIADLQTIYTDAMKTTKKNKDDQPKQKAYIDAYNKRKAELSEGA